MKTMCPRCGEMKIKQELSTNALSRQAEVYVCDDCGTDEAIRAYTGDILPLTAWVINQPQYRASTQGYSACLEKNSR